MHWLAVSGAVLLAAALAAGCLSLITTAVPTPAAALLLTASTPGLLDWARRLDSLDDTEDLR